MMRDLPAGARLGDLSGPCLLYINVDWCGHCRAAKPILQKVAGITGSQVPVISVNGDNNKALATQLGAQGFPTIVYMDGAGKLFRYTGERTVDAIASFVCHNSSSRLDFCEMI